MADDATAETNAGVDLDRLRPYFAEHVPLAGDKPLSAELIAGGRSNLTYAISNGTSTWVLAHRAFTVPVVMRGATSIKTTWNSFATSSWRSNRASR